MTRFRRQRLAAIFPVDAVGQVTDEWSPGPAPFEHRNVKADTATRLSYFDVRIGRALYGADEPRRWHRSLPDDTGIIRGLRPTTLELARTQVLGAPATSFLVVHGDLTSENPAESIGRWTGFSGADIASVNNSLAPILGGIAEIDGAVKRATTLSLVTPAEQLVDPFPAGYDAWTVSEKWLWLLASGTPFERYPPDPEAVDSLRRSTLRLSRDWQALVLRDGAAFLGLRPDLGIEDPFYGEAELYFASIYLDAILLGLVQRAALNQLANEVAELDDPVASPEGVRRLERRTTHFRNVYWWTHLTGHGPANDLTRLLGDQHRLDALATQLFEEVGEYSRQVQTAATDRTNALLGLITIVGLPLGAVFGIFQVVGETSPYALLGACVSVLILAAALAATLARPLVEPLMRAFGARTAVTRDRDPDALD